ncbi:hypothetical protein KC19_VG025300 [Ceratodon purpureus]|uniref:Uncharacterized protein n=1 Tax=Ceratodon purpureus TaxID=3225 RepID=A0A8T0HLD1_CERPU|nr:hypothetical protein KC19_VG025300 [Ceratodon purpureus]
MQPERRGGGKAQRQIGGTRGRKEEAASAVRHSWTSSSTSSTSSSSSSYTSCSCFPASPILSLVPPRLESLSPVELFPVSSSISARRPPSSESARYAPGPRWFKAFAHVSALLDRGVYPDSDG